MTSKTTSEHDMQMHKIDPDHFGDILRGVRIRLRITQVQLSEAAHVSCDRSVATSVGNVLRTRLAGVPLASPWG
jgi:hypothetical protein